MTKKTILITFIFFILISCGKKGDPEYKESKKTQIQNILIVKI